MTLFWIVYMAIVRVTYLLAGLAFLILGLPFFSIGIITLFGLLSKFNVVNLMFSLLFIQGGLTMLLLSACCFEWGYGKKFLFNSIRTNFNQPKSKIQEFAFPKIHKLIFTSGITLSIIFVLFYLMK